MTHRISRIFTVLILSIAILAGLTWLFLDAHQAARVFAAVLIVACPCALALSAPFAFGAALRILRRHGLYLKNGAVVEGMSRVRHLAFDKTGTLTRGGVGDVVWEGRALDHELQGAVQTMAQGSTHPLSRAIDKSLPQSKTQLDSFAEHPGMGVEAWWRDQHLRLGSRAWLARAGLDLPAEHWHGAECFLAVDQQVKGRFHFSDLPREGMVDAMPALVRDYDLTVLTGDRAEGLARLREWFPGCKDARPGLSPSDKLEAIETLRADGRAVMMVGDGLNDAGALRRSDVGVAVAEDIQAFSPACDAILDAKALPRLPAFLALSRASARVVRLCFGVSIAYNVIGVSVAASGQLSPLIAALLMPLSSVSVILISVLGTRAAGRRLGLKAGTA
jgi:P-type Cu+ transporter